MTAIRRELIIKLKKRPGEETRKREVEKEADGWPNGVLQLDDMCIAKTVEMQLQAQKMDEINQTSHSMPEEQSFWN
jgi:hypothetical protein